MKIRLHKPRQIIWNAALILFILGVAAPYVPFLAVYAFPLVVFAAALLILGTWLF